MCESFDSYRFPILKRLGLPETSHSLVLKGEWGSASYNNPYMIPIYTPRMVDIFTAVGYLAFIETTPPPRPESLVTLMTTSWYWCLVGNMGLYKKDYTGIL